MSLDRTLHSEECKRFCRHLRATLKAKEHTQTQLSEKLDRPQSYVSKCLNQERRVDFVEIYRMCRALGIPLKDFAGEVEEIFDELLEEENNCPPPLRKFLYIYQGWKQRVSSAGKSTFVTMCQISCRCFSSRRGNRCEYQANGLGQYGYDRISPGTRIMHEQEKA